jgi:AcrR family transcriptional regulator
VGVEATFTLRDLVERTRVPATTIHHYQRLGLLPPSARVAPNRFVYDDRHVQALRLIRLLRERRRLGLAAIGRILPQLLARDEQAFRARMWEDVIATDVDDTTTQARARILAVARRELSSHGFANVSVADICDEVGIGKGSFYELFSSKEDLFVAAARALVDDLVAALAARRPGHPLAAKTITTVLDDALSDEAPLLVEAVLRGVHGKPDDARAARDTAATLRDAVAGRLRAAPTDETRAAAQRLVEACLGRALGRALAASPKA